MHSGRTRRVASEAEIRSALEALSTRDRLILAGFARQRMRKVGLLYDASEPPDLVQEAVLLTLERIRLWRPEQVTFRGHLLGAIRSLASHLAEAQANRPVRLNPAVRSDRPGDPDSELPEREVEDPAALPYKTIAAMQILEQLDRAIGPDVKLRRFAESAAVHGGDSAPGPLIQRDLGITEREYRALRSRLDRLLHKIFAPGEWHD